MSNAAITLVALVITIIVLLILAGVALYMTLGDSGIFGKANTAKEQTNIKSATELMNLKILEIKTKGYAENETVDLQYLANNLIADTEIEYVSNTSNPTEPYANTIDTTGKTAIYTKLKAYPYEFTINDGMEVTNVDGQAISTISSGGSSSGSTGGSTSGGTSAVSDYTTNLIYRLNLQTDLASQPGVTVAGSGVTVSNDKKYVTFDANSYINVSNDTVMPNASDRTKANSTICLWYKTIVNAQNPMCCFGENSHNGVYNIHNMGNSGPSFGAYQGYATIARYIDPDDKIDGNWHSLISVWENGDTLTLYYDGVPFKSTGSYTMTNSWLNIGGISDVTSWVGDISDVRIYDEALTKAQVKQVYQWGKQYLGIQP